MTLSLWAAILATAALLATIAGEAADALRAYLRYRRIKAEAEADVAQHIARGLTADKPPQPPPAGLN